ncbi:ISNCY family transposase [Limnohabitans sp. 2KL-51]|uniref:ISNCY family transposase n=1 Tax=Limnohabitans sp. 2KL-51 TaxID=1977911 RepID=UPI000D3AAFBA|nr:ISNCY family transposase [Limnohabitans sp. 2KL-51]PUE52577.1 transposase [Limnohabitans sp. 2KL-51]
MRFEQAYVGWNEGRLNQSEAAELLGQCERSFRRHVQRYEADGLQGLLDRRLSQISKRRASAAEVDQVVELYKTSFAGWNLSHFHSKYKAEFKGLRSYSWLKSVLQGAGAAKVHKARGKHRIKRDRAPLAGMMIHQDASTHRWVDQSVWDLVVTMDDATGEHTSMFFCEQEGSASSFHGIGQTIARYGLFASLYTDRGAHYFTTPKAGGKVDKVNLTQLGRALKQLGIGHIAAYSPQARGRSERAFQTHQGRLPQELARAGITDIQAANRYLEEVYRPGHNREFGVASRCEGTAYVPFISGNLPDILCEQHERTADNDNCVSFEAMQLQIPTDEFRYHYVHTRLRVHRYVDATLAVFHGPRRLACYDAKGQQRQDPGKEQRLAA